MFFFEKKNQKTFTCPVENEPWPEHTGVFRRRCVMSAPAG
jgi:hypothetical protein